MHPVLSEVLDINEEHVECNSCMYDCHSFFEANPGRLKQLKEGRVEMGEVTLIDQTYLLFSTRKRI